MLVKFIMAQRTNLLTCIRRHTPNMLRHRRDDGNAMVLTMATVLLTGMMMAVILSTLVFSVGHTTANRAAVESQAAAEGGAEQVAAYLMNRTEDTSVTCPANWGEINPQPEWVDYEVYQVEYEPDHGAGWVVCEPGDAIPALAAGIRITTIGYSEAKGQRGVSRGNQASVQVTYTRPDSVTFNSAVYGQSYIEANTSFNVKGDDVDVVANGEWYCPAQSHVTGSVYALHGVRGNTINTSCSMDGNFYVNGNLEFSASPIYIGGDLIVNGNLQLTTANGVTVGGRVIVNGNLLMGNGGASFNGPVQVLGNFTTPGGGSHYETNLGQSFPGGLWVRGNVPAPSWAEAAFYNSFNGVNFYGGSTTPGARLHIGYPIPDDWQTPFHRTTAWADLTEEALDNLALWDSWQGWTPAPNPPVGGSPNRGQSDLVTALDILFNPNHTLRDFPVLTRESPMWAGMIEVSWATLQSQYGETWSSCHINNASRPMLIQDPTIIDFTQICPGGLTIASANFQLDADLVIFATNITVNGSVTINPGPNTTGNTKNSLYLIIPADDEEQTCASPNGNIMGNSGAWRQDDKNTATLLYAFGTVNLTTRIASPNQFVGQIYGCEVRTPSGIDMVFSRVGTDADLTNTLYDLRWRSTRSITDLVP